MTFDFRAFCLAALLMAPGPALAAGPAPFDLAGPKLEATVTHAGRTLPISQAPNLSEGDRLWIKADLPAGQSVHYLLVAAFLQGATNPPPAGWFASSQTWTRKGAEGLRITVPKGAQQLLLFLAPETGGGFKAIVNAVRGRPGAFVRASQDLNQATLDRSRLDAYLAAIRKIDQADPDHLQTVSPLLARSLTIKLDATCLQRAVEQRASCLTQGQDSLVLNDGQSTSMVQALTSGYSADLVQALSATPKAGSGYYSPYIASVMDIAHILDSFHTAQYQYIPALVTEQDDRLSLMLNAPPSFQTPQSVLVVAMPAIEAAQTPPLHAIDPDQTYCIEQRGLVLPADGAPLAFSTQYAHDMVLRLKDKDGKVVDLPARADAEKGGFAVDAAGLQPADLQDAFDGALHGAWGFEPYDGPTFHFQNARPQHWQVIADDQNPLIAGHDGAVRLRAPGAACIESIMLQPPSGEAAKVDWKPTQPGEVAVTLPLKTAQPGAQTLLIGQYGRQEADTAALQVFAHAGDLQGFSVHAGDVFGVLRGDRLEEVKGLTLAGVQFAPAPSPSPDGGDGLVMTASDTVATSRLKPGETKTAKVALQDGRTVSLKVSVGAVRPRVSLIDKSVQPDAASGPGLIHLAGQDELAHDARLTFSIRAEAPTSFSGAEKVEIATGQGDIVATLTAANGLTLEDSQIALATLDTAKSLGASAFGPLRFRVAQGEAAGDWQPLATLVRLPILEGLKCSSGPDQGCELKGANLFLIDSLSADRGFDHPVTVPEGFAGSVLTVPHPTRGRLYVKLHDAPTVVNLAAFPLQGAAGGPAAGTR
jgi:hypothetical protein